MSNGDTYWRSAAGVVAATIGGSGAGGAGAGRASLGVSAASFFEAPFTLDFPLSFAAACLRSLFSRLFSALVFLGFTAFIVYGTWRAFENRYFEFAQYLSPFYSPYFSFPWWKFSPALLILWIPGGFRATCYYYRKAYYRAYFLDPPACAVSHFGGHKYCGENSLPLILQNIHRYFFYLAVLVLIVLWYDAVKAFVFEGKFGISLVSLVMLLNVILLSAYSFGCHACRHLLGGRLDCFSKSGLAKNQFRLWKFVTALNEHHMLWAWLSLFSVGFTDFYIRQVASGVFPEVRLF